jgi:hypothetical protein
MKLDRPGNPNSDPSRIQLTDFDKICFPLSAKEKSVCIEKGIDYFGKTSS